MRILDRITTTGRRLTADERRAVDEMHAKYPTVPMKPKPVFRAKKAVRNVRK